MTTAKEFQGKTLDDAINSACSFFGVKREKLEIEIINDSKTGIFGLVNVKQAKIKARKVDTPALLEKLPPMGKDQEREKDQEAQGKKKADAKGQGSKPGSRQDSRQGRRQDSKQEDGRKAGQQKRDSKSQDKAQTERKPRSDNKARKDDSERSPEKKDLNENKKSKPSRSRPETRQKDSRPDSREDALEDSRGDFHQDSSKGKKSSAPKEERVQARGDDRPQARDQKGGDDDMRGVGRRKREMRGPRPESDKPVRQDYAPLKPVDLEAIPEEELLDLVYEVVEKIVIPISDQAEIEVELDREHIRVEIECGDDAGILVGREGQTLSAVQYMISRIVGNRLGGIVRMHIDTADYRKNQDERLTQLALNLAERAKESGRTQSTRPLSAYQRRIVHIALEEDEEVQTTSRGEGRQRRVLIHLNRK